MYTVPLENSLDEKDFAFSTGVAFRGLTVSPGREGWNIIVRGTERDATPVYAMLTADHPVEGLKTLLSTLSSKGGQSLWRLDKYAAGYQR